MAVKNYLINDKWLDIDKQNIVEVKSTDGVIGSVKLNGEEYGGGSSDFSTAKVTITNNNGIEMYILGSLIDNEAINYTTEVASRDTSIIEAVLYKGRGLLIVDSEGIVITVSGDAELDGNSIIITGDCAVTINPVS